MFSTCQRIRQPLIARFVNKRASLHVLSAEEKSDTCYLASPTVFWADREPQPLPQKGSLPISTELTAKPASDSYVEKFLPFKSDPKFLDNYIFANGKIRIGKILEDLDLISGAVALKHVGSSGSAATVSFDRLDLLVPELEIKDYILSAHPSYVGKSSLEVLVKAETVPENGEPKQTVFTNTSISVGLDPVTLAPIKISPLKITSAEEKALFLAGVSNKVQRQKVSSKLSQEEYLQEYNYLIDTINTKGPIETVWMEETAFHSSFVMFPQDRNLNDKVFGGYLMRRAYETAHTNTSLFMKSYPKFVSMDKAVFNKPTQVGSVLNLKSMIVSSEDYKVQVRVVAETTEVGTGDKQVTNEFYFTVAADERTRLPVVIPKTDEGRNLWVDAYRRKLTAHRERNFWWDAYRKRLTAHK